MDKDVLAKELAEGEVGGNEWAAMKIWIDADACPVVVREILYKASERTGVTLTLVANRTIRTPPSSRIAFLLVGAGADIADNKIVELVEPDDLVITADIPLAAKIIDENAFALNPRGELYTAENVKDRLSMRDFMDSLRENGVDTGGPPAMSKNDRQNFANQLDKFLTRHLKK